MNKNYRYSKNPENRQLPWDKAVLRAFKTKLFPTWGQSLLSVVLLVFIAILLSRLFSYFVLDSVWSADAQVCRESSGYCWSFIKDKYRFILFGLYPREEQWRLIIVILLFGISFFMAVKPRFWQKRFYRFFLGISLLIFLFMRGDVFGLTLVETTKWGGLPLTLILASVALIVSYPLGILLALARQSQDFPILKSLSIAFIELIRGIPLISLLFMSSLILPLFLPEGVSVNQLLRAQIALILFNSAYMAEVVRGGLQSVAKGQKEAAFALGLSKAQTLRLIVLPQALKTVIPPTVNTAIGLFKDTSLVIVIALFDLMNTARASVQDAVWRGFSIEAYLFIGVIYFIICYAMSQSGKRLENSLGSPKENL